VFWSNLPDTPRTDGPNQRTLWVLADQLVPRRRPGDWNQALMELGALVCLPTRPNCADCPLRTHCAAHRAGVQDRVPRPRRRVESKLIERVVLAIHLRDRILMYRRPENGLWAGLLELPGTDLDNGRSVKTAAVQLAKSLRLGRHRRVLIDVVERVLTHRRFRFHVFRISDTGSAFNPRDPYDWVDPSHPPGGLSTAARVIIDRAAP
jgi:A/G-specific adenine glycosylase